MLAATRSQRHYVGDVTPDGQVHFEDIPPGQYTLEADFYHFESTNRFRMHEVPVTGQVRARVTVLQTGDPVQVGPLLLGSPR